MKDISEGRAATDRARQHVANLRHISYVNGFNACVSIACRWIANFRAVNRGTWPMLDALEDALKRARPRDGEV